MDRRTLLIAAPAVLIAGRMAGASAQPGEAAPFHATAESRITLLYLGQASCPPCRGYEAEYFGRMDKMAKSFPEFREIDYVKLSLGSGKAVVTAGLLPDHLKWVATETRDGHAIIQNAYGTPFFAAVVDHEVWAQGPAVSGLEGEVLPALRRAVQERARSARVPS
ncbi:hypothetical protein AB4Z48_25900 [Cupriavidus sp. 2TAF22]|uniref:hypothetical protein n=1 Tax=unclassified Cupriavidus TaxID=2640874 RepID=UPI003F8E55FD